MVGSLLKKANLSTPHRPSTCAAIFLFVDAASLWRAEIVKASLPEVNQFTGNCFRVVRIVLKITFFEIKISRPTPLESLSVLLWLLKQTNMHTSLFASIEVILKVKRCGFRQ